MAADGHLITLDKDECRHLLRDGRVGRIAWEAGPGPRILPVAYQVVGESVLFRTSHGSELAGLLERVPVAFEVDDVDVETETGWSIVVHGTSGPADAGLLVELPNPWAPGERTVVVAITIDEITGRAVASSF